MHPKRPCPACDKRDLDKYGFILEDGSYYYTQDKNIKNCCAVKVQLISHDSATCKYTYQNKEYSKSYKDFMTSSWRDYDSF